MKLPSSPNFMFLKYSESLQTKSNPSQLTFSEKKWILIPTIFHLELLSF